MEQHQYLALEDQGLSFLWLELTSKCNLRCVHCYAESEASPSPNDVLTHTDYCEIIRSAASLGCKRIQFIGGEPTLYAALPQLIEHARSYDYDFIEVFTNATRISDELLSCFVHNNVAIATSFYCDDPNIHDAVTKRSGSHLATVRTLRRLLDAEIEVRAGIIVMEVNASRLRETTEFLQDLGVKSIGTDRVRGVGRGSVLVPTPASASTLTELCGSCWRGSVCVGPDGVVSPCIMAKQWSVGSVLDTPLHRLVASEALQDIRTRIYNDVWLPTQEDAPDYRLDCNPNCAPSCNPVCSPNCNPCYPAGKCNPELFCGPCGPGR